MDRGSDRDSRECNNNDSVLNTDDGPVTVTMVGTPEASLSGGGGGGGDTLTDPFAAVFSVPPPPLDHETTKSATASAKSTARAGGVRGWKNLEDYDFV